jgi:hypothetical protein
MTRSPVGVSLRLLGLLIVIGLAGCGGTETGNPSGGGGRGNPAARLGGAICEKLTGCFGDVDGFTKEDCEGTIAESDALGSAFGLEEEPPPDYAEVIDKVEVRELSANEDAVDECEEAIQSLDCKDPAVLEVDTQDAFRNVEAMVRDESCSQVFSAP